MSATSCWSFTWSSLEASLNSFWDGSGELSTWLRCWLKACLLPKIMVNSLVSWASCSVFLGDLDCSKAILVTPSLINPSLMSLRSSVLRGISTFFGFLKADNLPVLDKSTPSAWYSVVGMPPGEVGMNKMLSPILFPKQDMSFSKWAFKLSLSSCVLTALKSSMCWWAFNGVISSCCTFSHLSLT